MTDYENKVISHQKQLYYHALCLTRNKELASDLLQDTLFRLLTNAGKYEECDKFIGWARRVMFNIFLNTYQTKEKLSTRPLIAGYDDGAEEPLLAVADSDCECNYSYSEITIAINSLSPESSHLLTLRAIGYKYDEIAEELHLPVGTIKSRLSAAKHNLRILLEM